MSERTPLLTVITPSSLNQSSDAGVHKNYKKPMLTIVVLVLFIVYVLLLLLITPTRILSDLNPNKIVNSNGLRVSLKSIVHNETLYLRLNMPNNDLILTDTFSKFQSTTFEMFLYEYDTCFKLRSLNGDWLRLSYSNV